MSLPVLSDNERSEKLLQLKQLLLEYSIQFGDFTLASGKKSSVYLDVRKTALRGDGAILIGALLTDAMFRVSEHFEGVGGMTLGADPLLSSISITSTTIGNPLHAIIVRKQSKDHGGRNQLEAAGGIPKKANIAVVDDVVTSAGSTIKAIDTLRKQFYQIEHAFCVVDREAGGQENLKKKEVTLHSLFRLSELMPKKGIQ